jgi:transposase
MKMDNDSTTPHSCEYRYNAPIHRKTVIRQLVEEAGHNILFLPKYSPDLNDIEHDFGALKRARMYADPGTSLDEIIRQYCTA